MSVYLTQICNKRIASVLLLITLTHFSPAQSLSGFVRDARTEEPLIGVTVALEDTNIGGVTLSKEDLS